LRRLSSERLMNSAGAAGFMAVLTWRPQPMSPRLFGLGSQAQPMTPEGAYIGSQAKPIPAGPQWAKEANWPAASRSDDDASGGSDERIPQSPMM
jgi:hypothetical protein